MASIISNNVSLSPVAALITRKSNPVSSCTIPRKLNAQTFPSRKHSLPLSTSIRLFPQFGTTCVLKPKLVTRTLVSTSGIDVAVEEADLSPADNQSSVTATDATDISGESSIKSEISPVKSKRSRVKRSVIPPVKIEELIPGATFKGKVSVIPPVKIEELIPGATFKGKVVSIHPFGAFVDFGAFTDGLVHVSCLYDGFVKDVGDFVTVGQEVTVRLTEANMETRRISLNMCESDDPAKAAQQQRDGPFSTDTQKYNQRNFVKGIDVAVEEADLSPADNQSSVTATDATDISGEESSIKSEISPVKSKPSRIKKSLMPPVKIEELIPGATFKGKVVSIQPFGAFVDFGAFTDGLVHVSRLCDGFVKDAGHVVTVGQEVTVGIIEANMETGRISLSMRENDDPAKAVQQQRDGSVSSDKSIPPRKYYRWRDETNKNSKFVKGQYLKGTVKNLTRAGAFISLPEGEDGFLPSLEVGQEVSVRVLQITRGKITLTMKMEDATELDAKLSQGEHVATMKKKM